MASPVQQACLENLKRAFDSLDSRFLGSSEVQHQIPEQDFKSLVARLRELRAQHAVLDWTTAFPTIYRKKTVKNFITKATLPHKCKNLDKAAEKWRRDAESASATANLVCQRVRKERLDRYRQEHPGALFDKHLAFEARSPTISEFSVPQWEARSITESKQSLSLDDVQSRRVVPWFLTEADSQSSIPSLDVSSGSSTLGDAKRPTPWLTRSPSGNSFHDNLIVSETLRIRTKSTTTSHQ